MIKAVFFDWSNTLARYSPSREEMQSQALRELGFSVSPQQIAPGIARADRYLFEETARSPVGSRPAEEQIQVYSRYQQMVLAEAGTAIPATSPAFATLMKRLNELYREMKFGLYDDVLPAMKELKSRKLVLALVTNMDTDMRAVCRDLGLSLYLDFVLTSAEAGASKPQPKIFLTALEYAGVLASEAAHVGDQLDIDVAGAKGVGIRPVLLDREGFFPDSAGYIRVRRLTEVAKHLE